MGVKGIALAMGVGYVLGAKAGEQRYAQIKEFWEHTGRPLVESPSVQRFGQLGTDAVSRTVEVVASRAQSGGQRFASAARERGGQRWMAAARDRGRVD
jgi:hypothetical protein